MMRKIIGSILISLCLLVGTVNRVSAQDAFCRDGVGGVAKGIDTAIGCIPVLGENGTQGITRFILQWGIGIAGGIALLLILYAGFLIMTSSGNPQRVQAGKELLGAAVSGILLLIFSTFILRFVGVDILGIF
jgi:hypothetical protein